MKNSKTFRSMMIVLVAIAVAVLAQAQTTATIIHRFDCNTEGCDPGPADLIAQGTDGNLYGTLPGGKSSWFEFPIGGSLQTTVFPLMYMHNLSANAGLTLGIDGNLYGGSAFGGSPANYGFLFKLVNGTADSIYTFPEGQGGAFEYGGNPMAPPIQGPDGNLYGVTSGSNGYVYQILTATNSYGWSKKLPSASNAPLLLASDGNLYGTFPNGFIDPVTCAVSPGGAGGVFKITLAGNLCGFYNIDPNQSDNNRNPYGEGGNPQGQVMQGNDGNLYGTAKNNGQSGGGVIFQLTLNGQYTVIHSFQDSDGTAPNGGVLQGSDNYLYLLTSAGGQPGGGKVGGGTLFRIQATGGNPSVVAWFYHNSSTDNRGPGFAPISTPVLHTSGRIYGMTSTGGTVDDAGVLFSYDTGMKTFISVVGVRSGRPGDRVGIIGQGFNKVIGIKFGGTSVPLTKANGFVFSDTYMTTTVPQFATVGPITVTESDGNVYTTPYNFIVPCTLANCLRRP